MSCLLVSVKPGCRRWRCSTWRRGKVRSLSNSNHQHSLVTIFLKEAECIMVAKIFKLDQGVLSPSLYNSLESTVEMSSMLFWFWILTNSANLDNLAARISFWLSLKSSPPWTHRWTRHKLLQWLACDGDRCSRCRRAALVWGGKLQNGFNRLYISSQILNAWFLKDAKQWYWWRSTFCTVYSFPCWPFLWGKLWSDSAPFPVSSMFGTQIKRVRTHGVLRWHK